MPRDPTSNYSFVSWPFARAPEPAHHVKLTMAGFQYLETASVLVPEAQSSGRQVYGAVQMKQFLAAAALVAALSATGAGTAYADAETTRTRPPSTQAAN